MNLLAPFLEQVGTDGNETAIVFGNEAISFKKLDRQSAALAYKFILAGLKEGDRVLLLTSVDISLYITLLALFRIGGVAVIPDPSIGFVNFFKCISMVKPIAGISVAKKYRWAGLLLRVTFRVRINLPTSADDNSSEINNATPVSDLLPDAPALISFTSGSTGRPKGIVRSHQFLLKQHQAVEKALEPNKGDRYLISLPVFVLSNLASGVTSVIPDCDLRKPGEIETAPVYEQIDRWKINRILAPPAFCERLADEAITTYRSISKVFTGGGPVFPALLNKLKTFAPTAKIVSVYGSTEAEPIAHISMDEISEADFALTGNGGGLLAGAPVDEVKLRIVENEIVVTGDHVVKGYVDSSDDASTKTLIDNEIWHRTGDAGKLDDRGRLWLLGRVKERVGKIYPFSVEAAARTIPSITNAAFFASNGKKISCDRKRE